MTPKEMEAKILELTETLKKRDKRLRKLEDKVKTGFKGKGDQGEALPSIDDQIKDDYAQIDVRAHYKKLNEEILKTIKDQALEQGQLYQTNMVQGAKYQQVLSKTLQRSKELFGNVEFGKRAYDGLGKTMKSFVALGEAQMETLVNNAAMFQKFGVSAESSGKLFDQAFLSLGQTPEQIDVLGRELVTLAQNLAMPPSELVENFNKAAVNMAYPVGQMVDNFEKLQKVSRTTGVSFETLSGKFGDTMDSFGGSAEVAGKLNAVLGDSLFNSIELLGMTEAERVTTISTRVRDKLASQGVTNVEDMGKFQLKAVADSMGVSVDEARRLLKGETTVEDAIKKVTGVDTASEKTVRGLGDFDTAVRRTRTELENWSLDTANKRMQLNRTKDLAQVLNTFALDSDKNGRLFLKIGKEFGVHSSFMARQVAIMSKTIPGFAGAARRIADSSESAEGFRLDLARLVEDGKRDSKAQAREVLDAYDAQPEELEQVIASSRLPAGHPALEVPTELHKLRPDRVESLKDRSLETEKVKGGKITTALDLSKDDFVKATKEGTKQGLLEALKQDRARTGGKKGALDDATATGL